MWKNKKDGKNLSCWKRTFVIGGLNQDRLIATAKKRGISLFDIVKISPRKMYISVNLNESEKFFAITKELCYNIKKVRETGKAIWVFRLLNNVGLAIGCLIFAIVGYFSSDLLFGFKFSGSGAVYKNQVLSYLNSQGVSQFKRFSDLKLDRLEDNVLANNENLTFVSLEKKGNYLSVYLVLKTDQLLSLDENATSLSATEDGVVESVKVYRGTSVVEVGDNIKSGDLLVKGEVEIKEQIVNVNVLAYVTVLSQKSFIYECDFEGWESVALIYAEQMLDGREITNGSVVCSVKSLEDGKIVYLYQVTIEYRCVYFAG